MKKNLFRKRKKIFHINFDYSAHTLLKKLDWILIQKKVHTCIESFQCQLHALVMMDTHIHLLIEIPDNQEHYFCEMLNKIFKLTEILIFCEPIEHYKQYLTTYKYIYRNPVEAHLCKSVELYEFSTLHQLLGHSVSYCQVIDCIGLIQNPYLTLQWLNNQSLEKTISLPFFQESSNRIY